MTGSVVDMTRFWWEVAAPAVSAVTLAAAYIFAAWRRPALRTPIASLRVWRFRRACRDVLGYLADGKVYHPEDVTIIREGKP